MVLPLILLGWGGIRLASHEQERVKANIQRLLTGRLNEIDRSIADQLATLAVDMQKVTSIDSYNLEELRDVVRNDPKIFQLFVINPDDVLLYPSPIGPHTEVERDFILKASDLVNDRQLQLSETASSNDGRKQTVSAPSQKMKTKSVAPARQAGDWFVWNWGPGINLIYWQRRENGHIVGVAVERARWIADIIAELPDTPSIAQGADSVPSRIQIVESGKDVIYKWGPFDPDPEEAPTAEFRLSSPLSAWQLQTFVPLHLMTAERSGTFNLIAGLVISGLALIGLAYAIDLQFGRELREASRRVSFVNQVSHELRTPLTNIRMYAELLDRDLDSLEENIEQPRKRLSVILSESQRLTRLIGNVLAFARQEKQTLRVCRKEVIVDEIIQTVLDSFRPSLEQKEIEVEFDLNATQPTMIDPDILEQILGNLISNVEKYAADGKWVKICSSQSEQEIRLIVADHGPGIDVSNRSKVFEPFWRASDLLSQSAGTGIGLTIVQYLARLHGGDVKVRSNGDGTQFEVNIQTSPEQEDES